MCSIRDTVFGINHGCFLPLCIIPLKVQVQRRSDLIGGGEVRSPCLMCSGRCLLWGIPHRKIKVQFPQQRGLVYVTPILTLPFSPTDEKLRLLYKDSVLAVTTEVNPKSRGGQNWTSGLLERKGFPVLTSVLQLHSRQKWWDVKNIQLNIQI